MGNGGSYLNSEKVSLQSVARTPTLGLRYKRAGFFYEVSLGTAKSFGQIVIPDVYNGEKVTTIPEKAFYDAENLTSISIPNTIIKIGAEAFAE